MTEMVGLTCRVGAHNSRYRSLSRRLERCDRVIQNESRYSFGGNVYYVTMQITILTRKFRNRERNLHCDVVHITTKWVSSLTLDCNGVFAIKAYAHDTRLYPILSPNLLLNDSCFKIIVDTRKITENFHMTNVTFLHHFCR